MGGADGKAGRGREKARWDSTRLPATLVGARPTPATAGHGRRLLEMCGTAPGDRSLQVQGRVLRGVQSCRLRRRARASGPTRPERLQPAQCQGVWAAELHAPCPPPPPRSPREGCAQCFHTVSPLSLGYLDPYVAHLNRCENALLVPKPTPAPHHLAVTATLDLGALPPLAPLRASVALRLGRGPGLNGDSRVPDATQRRQTWAHPPPATQGAHLLWVSQSTQ